MFYPLNYRSPEPPPGVEPGTSFVPGMCSIQLSYSGKTANNTSAWEGNTMSSRGREQAQSSAGTALRVVIYRNSGSEESSVDTSVESMA